MNDMDIKNAVMRRVYFAYTLKKLAEFPCLECAALAALACISMLFVSVKNIFMNIYYLHTITAFPGYFLSAFLKTHTVDKLIAIIALVICTKLAWETSRGAARVSVKVAGNLMYFARQIV